jgi:hypothetical protein
MSDSSWYQRFKSGVESVLGNPTVQKVADIGERVLEITQSLADNKNALSVGAAIASGANVLADALDISYIGPVITYCNKHNLSVKSGSLHRLLIKTGLSGPQQPRIVCRGDKVLQRVILSPDTQIYYTVSEPESEYHVDRDSLADSYWINSDFDPADVSEFFWSRYRNGINLSYGNQSGMFYEVEISGLSAARPYINTNHSVDEIYAYICAARQAGISRSFILAGKPGTGKSSLVENLANRFSNKIIKVEASFLEAASNPEVFSLIELLQPEILLLDDFDRVDFEEEEGKFLYLIETLKRQYPNLVIFATINNPEKLTEAITREGRFDETLEFNELSAEDQLAILEHYCQMFGLEPPTQSDLPGLTEVEVAPVKLEEMVKRKKLTPSKSWMELYLEKAISLRETNNEED